MKAVLMILATILSSGLAGQERDMEEHMSGALELYAERNEDEVEDLPDADHEYLAKHPINLNLVTAEELKTYSLLNDLQIRNLVLYRKTLGLLLHIYELQAIPGWDITTIRKILPYIAIGDGNAGEVFNQLYKGEHKITIRYGKPMEASNGIKTGKYLGSNDRYSLRYKYRYKQQVSWGFTTDKDVGEPVLRHAQKAGFDFYSFHIFFQKIAGFQSIALGDFTASMGQGLIHWQHLAFKKSAAVINIKRQSPVLRAYSGAAEFNFLRGIGVTIRKKDLECTGFLSRTRLSANLDRQAGEEISISSFLASGNHRSIAEMADRFAASRMTAGAVLRLSRENWHIAMNGIYHRFSHPILKRDEPYNLYATKGKTFMNNSIDYAYTFKNIHFFGELAVDQQLQTAFLHGLMVSLDPKVDMAFLYRRISKRYQAVTGNAFTENTTPGNESGWYAAITLRPVASVSIDAFLDVFRFPWIKYRVNAPSSGRDYLFSINFKPNKQAEFYSRIKSSGKMQNQSASGLPIDAIQNIETGSWRTHATVKLNRSFTLQQRFELSAFRTKNLIPEEGCMLFTDLSFKPPFASWSTRARVQFFDIDSYESRIYAYEARFPSMFSVPAFYGKGKRYLLNINYRFPLGARGYSIQTSLAWSQTFYENVESSGSGLDEVAGNRRSDLNIQVILLKE